MALAGTGACRGCGAGFIPPSYAAPAGDRARRRYRGAEARGNLALVGARPLDGNPLVPAHADWAELDLFAWRKTESVDCPARVAQLRRDEARAAPSIE